MQAFEHGPFEYRPAQAGRWSVYYGRERLGTRRVEADTRTSIVEALADDLAEWQRELMPKVARTEARAVEVAYLVRSCDVVGVAAGSLGEMPIAAEVPGLTSGLIDDRFATWLVAGGLCMPMSVDEFERLRAAHLAVAAADAKAMEARSRATIKAPTRGWVCELLPDAILTTDPAQWRAPSAWEIRHIVGEGSFTRTSGARAAELVGVTPQNFRKYTARDGAAGQQRISFAMWHLLLHRLDVQLMQ